jgi:antibiotic biosynthesis monooxygenase (ABM) superfamily enzyme
MSVATAISAYHCGGGAAEFARCAAGLAVSAGAATGYVTGQVAADESCFDRATSVTFTSAAALHAWLDSPDRSQLLAEAGAGGFPRISSDIIVDADSSSTGVSVFRHTVTTGDEADFVRAQTELVRLSAAFSGFEGATLLRPARSGGDWLSVLRFRTDRQLQAWVDSAERRAALPDLRSHLAEDFTVVTSRAPFGSILRTQDGTTRVTPEWKTAMLVLLVLYPTVMTLSRFLGPVLDDAGAQPWLSMWLSQIVSVALMTWLLMPWMTGLFRRWLDPVDGAGARVSLIGAGVAVVGYAVTLTIFGSVKWLQFWDYLD